MGPEILKPKFLLTVFQNGNTKHPNSKKEEMNKTFTVDGIQQFRDRDSLTKYAVSGQAFIFTGNI